MKLFTNKSGITINISTEAIVRTIVISVLTLMFLRFIGSIAHQLQLIFVAAFLALALNPAVSGLARQLKIKSRGAAVGVAYVIVLSILAIFLSLVVPPLFTQTVEFLRDVPETVQNVSSQDSALGNFVRRYELDQEIDQLTANIRGRIGEAPATALSAVSRVGGTLISLITVIVLSFMMLIEGPAWLKRLSDMQPSSKRAHRKELAQKMYRVVTGYVNGQVLIAAIAALFALAALLIGSTITDASVNAVAMAGIVFLFGLIPLIGNTLAAAIVVLVCLFSSVPLAIAMAIYFLVYQQVENATLQPYIQAKSNQLTPLIVFVAALIGGGFGGILGAFVAIPAAGCLRILLEDHFGEHLGFTEEKDPKVKA